MSGFEFKRLSLLTAASPGLYQFPTLNVLKEYKFRIPIGYMCHTDIKRGVEILC